MAFVTHGNNLLQRYGDKLGFRRSNRARESPVKIRPAEMLVTGDTIDAAEAYRMGLVNYIMAADELLSFSRAWLRKVLANGPRAIALAVEAVDVGLDCGLDEGLRFEAAAFGLSAATDDRREGTRAFLEKRKPAFAGK